MTLGTGAEWLYQHEMYSLRPGRRETILLLQACENWRPFFSHKVGLHEQRRIIGKMKMFHISEKLYIQYGAAAAAAAAAKAQFVPNKRLHKLHTCKDLVDLAHFSHTV